jgi:hypothetical protein
MSSGAPGSRFIRSSRHPEREVIPTFHEYAEEWWLRNERQLAPNTQLDYRRRLETHLLPFFGQHRLDEITFDEVERYIAGKLVEDDPAVAEVGEYDGHAARCDP